MTYLIDVCRALRDVDKRRLEGKVALHFWRQVWWGIAKIALSGSYLLAVGLSVGGFMPPQLHDLAELLKSLYSGSSGTELIFSGGLGGVSVVSIVLNLRGLKQDFDWLDRTVRVAERHALKKSVR